MVPYSQQNVSSVLPELLQACCCGQQVPSVSTTLSAGHSQPQE